MSLPQFILYSRSYCHLCDDMLLALQSKFLASTYQLSVQDVDQDPAALALYDELVPVLVVRAENGTETELCHYFLNEERVSEFLMIYGK